MNNYKQTRFLRKLKRLMQKSVPFALALSIASSSVNYSEETFNTSEKLVAANSQSKFISSYTNVEANWIKESVFDPATGKSPVINFVDNLYLAFSDVNNSHWAVNSIYKLGFAGYVSGYSDGSFKPEKSITRAEFLSMEVSTLEINLSEQKAPFNDVKEAAWYNDFIRTAYSNGLASGISATEFGPTKNITREAAMVFAVKAIENYAGKKITASATSSYSDVKSVSDYAVPFVLKAEKLGLINVYSGNKLNPKQNITRAEVANLLVNMKEYINGSKLEKPCVVSKDSIVLGDKWYVDDVMGTTSTEFTDDFLRRLEKIMYGDIVYYEPLTPTVAWSEYNVSMANLSSYTDEYKKVKAMLESSTYAALKNDKGQLIVEVKRTTEKDVPGPFGSYSYSTRALPVRSMVRRYEIREVAGLKNEESVALTAPTKVLSFSNENNE